MTNRDLAKALMRDGLLYEIKSSHATVTIYGQIENDKPWKICVIKNEEK